MITFFFGISGQWWKRSHNTHHIFPNSLDWDPDIQHLPFLAIDPKILGGIYSFYHNHMFEFDAWCAFFIRWQYILFWIVMALARNFMYVQSWLLVWDEKTYVHYRSTEKCMVLGYWVWFLALLYQIPSWTLIFAVYMISHAFCGILHHQITLSHFAMEAYTGTGYVGSENDHFIK